MKTRKRKIEIGIVSDVANFRRKIIIGLATLLMGIFVLPASAQCEAKNDAFKSGEHVMYDLYFNWKFVWVKAGLASLTTNAFVRKQGKQRTQLLTTRSLPIVSICWLWAVSGRISSLKCGIR